MRLLATLLALAPTLAFADPPAFSPAEKTELEKGEVLIKRAEPKGGKGVAARAAALVKMAPDKVWDTINDCAHYREFMPETVKSELRAEGAHCFVEVSLPFPFSNLWSETRVTKSVLDDGSRRRQWRLHEGTYEHLEGSWTVLPWGENETLLLYSIDANPDVSLPDAILRAAQGGTLPKLFDAVRKRSGAPWPGRG